MNIERRAGFTLAIAAAMLLGAGAWKLFEWLVW